MRDPRLEIHDLRFAKGRNDVFFDVTVPENTTFSNEELEKAMEKAMGDLDEKHYVFHITLHL